MDIHPTYNCLLKRSWIHEDGDVPSILHQNLKFVKNKKLVVAGGEKALLVRHLSSFTYVEAKEEVGTPFQALSFVDEMKTGASMSSLKDAQEFIQVGRLLKTRTGLGWDFSKGHSTPTPRLCNKFSIVDGSFMGMINT